MNEIKFLILKLSNFCFFLAFAITSVVLWCTGYKGEGLIIAGAAFMSFMSLIGAR